MPKKYNRKSVFITLLLSFIIVLLFPITVETFLYKRMESIIKENADRSNMAMLKQTSDVVDNELQQITHLSEQISFNPKLHFILSQINVTDEENVMKYYNFMKDIKNYNISNTFIYDYYVYLPSKEVIITPTAKTDLKTFYDYFYSYQEMNYDAWKKEMMSTNQVQRYIPSSIVLEGRSLSPVPVITYLQPLPYGETKNPRGYLAILINEQGIRNILKSLEWANQGDIYILDNQNNEIMTTAESDLQLSNMDFQLNGMNGILHRKIDNKNMIVSYVVSKKTGWKYISIVPKSLLMQKVNAVKLWAMSLLIFCLIGGFIASYYLAKRHYIPIKDLVDSIVKKREDKVLHVNEYHMIKASLNDTWEAEKKLKDALVEQTPQIKANFFIRLINGFVDQSTITRESLKFMDISFNSKKFAVFVIDVEDCGRFAQEDSEKQWAIIRFMVSNISEELVNEYHKGFIVELDQKRLGVILNVYDAQNSRFTIDEVVINLKEIIEERLDIIISIGIGNVYEGMENIVKTYREAVQALKYRMIKGNSRIIYFSETNEAEDDYYYPPEIEGQLINFIKIADFKNVEKILDNLFSVNFESRNITLQIGKCLFFNIMNTQLKILNDIKINYNTIFQQEQDPVKQLLECQTVEEMHFKIKEIYKRLCNYMKDNRSNQSERLVNNVIQYIEEHYADNTLSLTSIAAEMNITPQYLSAFFKKHKGENITEYIAKVRLTCAKSMLADETLTILQIAKQIGYSNDIGLIRLFKKYEGVTPGNYRTQFHDQNKISNE
ncbi:helix-turn-helix domain-containing protein [Lederbergia lenta]|uniref:helix-turn-helix domain-containing protein n=1 Tax=Lederbergia lenta TaxID=1467 RepID=UPI00203C2C50|nr:helix-turn-helix domain-containing protein [Lederbergia lenta]MCM3110857.1 helix-turn-helix domain-containing protein [Lederbergia lenta]